ncbi:MAG: hypothetical protein EYC68_20430 [Chloroflexota bacterium]|nr:MAG: hypothetical protein EYC68_20430 [Chloroflexota bacterium]
MNHLIRTFSEISVTDVPLVGGKGANLGEMTRAGLPVPPGFCVSADAYRQFTAPAQETIARSLNETRMDDANEVETKTAQLREFLIAQPMPQDIAQQILDAYAELQKQVYGKKEPSSAFPIAVRSSATAEDLPDASFAGQQDTYLNVRGDEQLLEHVKRCWASLWTARAVIYRHKQGYAHEQVALAVVVQGMIESEVAGILFTANPVNNRRDEMVLNASWGLGEAIVSGLVTPDTWIVKQGGEILEREIANKEIAIEYAAEGGTRENVVPRDKAEIACLNDDEIFALAQIGARVQEHYARPMDIEWAFARGKFYMLQARPITTLTTDDRPQTTARTADELSSVTGEYNRSMFIEIFPDPLSPAFLSVIAPLFESMLAFTFETLGFKPPRDIPAIGIFYNQPYFHREYIQAALAPLSPPVQAALVTQIVNPFGRHERKLPTETSPAFLGMVTRLLNFMTRFPKQLPPLLVSYRAEIEKFNALKMDKLSDSELLSRVRELLFTQASKLLNYDFLMIALIGITYQMLGTLLEKYYGDDSEQVRAKLISGVTGNVTMETNKRIWKLAQEAKASPTVREILLTAQDERLREQPRVREQPSVREKLQADGDGRIFLAELDAFLEQYGHREIRMDILYPTWGEDPAPVLQFIRGYFDADEKASPFAQQERLVREREQLAQQVDVRVERDVAGRLVVAPLFHWVLKNTQTHTRERDTMHFELTRLFPPFRRALLELGARWRTRSLLANADDIFFLTLDEMDALAENPRPMQSVVAERRAEFELNAQRNPPAILRDGVGVETARALNESASGQLRGIAGSPGVVTGIVRVVRGPAEFEKLQRGEILVAPLTNPVWTPLFAIAGGIITQVGGILSHGAIVAREYGIPAVMAVADATLILRDGQRVTVDGNRGVVVLEQ